MRIDVVERGPSLLCILIKQRCSADVGAWLRCLSGLDQATLRCLFSSRSVLVASVSPRVADAMKHWAVIYSYLWV